MWISLEEFWWYKSKIYERMSQGTRNIYVCSSSMQVCHFSYFFFFSFLICNFCFLWIGILSSQSSASSHFGFIISFMLYSFHFLFFGNISKNLFNCRLLLLRDWIHSHDGSYSPRFPLVALHPRKLTAFASFQPMHWPGLLPFAVTV